jgi:hypothetical protein
MRKAISVALFTMAIAMTAAALKIEGTTALRDFQPAGTTDKNHKNQQYDLSFAAAGKQYTCRSNEKKSLRASDFVVGSDLKFEIGKDKGKLKSSTGKEIKCTVVRVAELPAAQ